MKKHFNNKGFSLVELIVVIAIMAVGIGAFTVSLTLVFSNNVRQCAMNIDSLLSRGKVSSNYRMPAVYIEITQEGNEWIGYYYEEGELSSTGISGTMVERKVLGTTRININYVRFNANSLPGVIAFERGTGQMLAVVAETDGEGVTSYVFKPFTFSDPVIELGGSGASPEYTVNLIPYTGGHEVSR